MKYGVENLDDYVVDIIDDCFGLVYDEACNMIEKELDSFVSKMTSAYNLSDLNAESICFMYVLHVANLKKKKREDELRAKIDPARLCAALSSEGYVCNDEGNWEKEIVNDECTTSVSISISIKTGGSYLFTTSNQEYSGSIPLEVVADSNPTTLITFLRSRLYEAWKCSSSEDSKYCILPRDGWQQIDTYV